MIYTVTLNPALDREYAVPAIAFDSVLRADDVRTDWGGKGFNVARGLAALEQEVSALGFAGGDAGRRLEIGLRDLGIQTDFVSIAGETRTNVSIVSSEEGRYVKVNEAGPVVTPAEQARLLGQIDQLARSGEWWILAGSLPRGVAVDFYAQLIEGLQRADASVALDTSGTPLRHGIAAQPRLLKPNSEEAAALFGRPVHSPAEAASVARKLRRDGVEQVVVSLGAGGAVAVDEAGGWHASPPAIVERNPIGAGDALVAALIWSLDRGQTLAEALRWGVAAGAAAAARAGTAFGNRKEIEALVTSVDLQPI